MKLRNFLNDLFSEGKITVVRAMLQFDEDDLFGSSVLLQQFYNADCLEMPYQAPAFEPAAALWAAQYLYRSCQFVLLRELDEIVMTEYLKPFEGEQTADAIYSVDLSFRYLKALFKFAAGISPDDHLVKLLKQTAGEWPFSSVGLNLDAFADTAVIFNHPSLKYTYLDRIIEHADLKRLNGEQEKETLNEILGLHQAQLWPGFNLLVVPGQTTL